MQESTELSFWVIFALILIPAAFGGILQGCHRHFRISNSSRNVNVPHRGLTWAELYLVAPGFGMGGGLAAILASTWLNKFSTEASLTNILSIVAMSTVAGFIGYRLLPAIAHGLEERLNVAEKTAFHAEKMAENLEGVSKKLEKEMKNNMDEAMKDFNYSITLSKGIAAAANKIPRDCLRSAERVSRIVKVKPTDRSLNILLGRLYRWGKDYDRAIGALDEFFGKKEELGQGEDEDVADILYNKSCYQTQKAENTSGLSADDKKSLFIKALETLERSVALLPENKLDARYDSDFDPLRNNPEYKEQFDKLISNEGK